MARGEGHCVPFSSPVEAILCEAEEYKLSCLMKATIESLCGGMLVILGGVLVSIYIYQKYICVFASYVESRGR